MTEMDSASFIETVVTSTRVRLARNLYSYPFPGKMTVQEAKEVIRTVGYELNRLDDFTEYDIGKIATEVCEIGRDGRTDRVRFAPFQDT